MNHSHEFIAIPKLCVDKYLMRGGEGKEREWKRKKGKER